MGRHPHYTSSFARPLRCPEDDQGQIGPITGAMKEPRRGDGIMGDRCGGSVIRVLWGLQEASMLTHKQA